MKYLLYPTRSQTWIWTGWGIFFLLSCAALVASGSYLEEIDGQKILHLEGTPYEMGYQHGKLLKESVQRNVSKFIDGPITGVAQLRIQHFKENLPELLPYIPEHFFEEMRGLAKGAEVPYEKILMLNLFPEMFHCSGIVLRGSATKDREMYHVRILDYGIGKSLQSTAVLLDVHPEEGLRFLNVSYAGFIGSITGMNEQKIALGEIGGHGYGNWNGIPMAFLLREVLERCSTLQEAKDFLVNATRTCEYYYVLSDGKDLSAVGIYATAKKIQFIEPGISYAIADFCDTNGDKQILSPSEINGMGAVFDQPEDCLAVMGYTNVASFPAFMERLKPHYGNVDLPLLQEMIKRPVAREANLHTAIFSPANLTVWIAHAGPNNEPACDQKYSCFSLTSE